MTEVTILLKGYFKWLSLNQAKVSSTVVLIKDNHRNILFDTGSFSEEENLKNALKKQGLRPEKIDLVVISHYHPDHVGNMHLFKKAEFIDGINRFQGNIHTANIFSMLKTKIKISENIELIKTPGHTSEGISLLVKTTKGKIAVTGDLFVKKQKEKVFFIENKRLFQHWRRRIIRGADYIIPGHGKMFKAEKSK